MTKKLVVLVFLIALALSPVLPSLVLAAEDLNGQVVKVAGSDTLYYITSDGQRFVFPNEKTYKTWFVDFTEVVEVSVEDLADYPLTGNIRYRPGIVLLKIQTDPKVYAVTRNGVLRWVKTERLAAKLYGDDWSSLIDDISASFFTNYSLGADIDEDDDLDVDAEVEENDTIEKSRGLKLGHYKNGKFEYGRRASTVKCRAIPAVPGRGQGTTIRAISARDCVHARNAEREADRDDQGETGELTIDNVDSTNATSTATITWTTNLDSSSKVTYATESIDTASTPEMITMVDLVTSHSLDLMGLTPSTTYYYIVESTDSDSNTVTSTQQMFTTDDIGAVDTTEPVISGISVTASTTSAIIVWTTDEASDSKVEYATTTLATAISTDSMSEASFVTSHSLEITGLATSTTYYFIIESEDASSNKAMSTEDMFTTNE